MASSMASPQARSGSFTDAQAFTDDSRSALQAKGPLSLGRCQRKRRNLLYTHRHANVKMAITCTEISLFMAVVGRHLPLTRILCTRASSKQQIELSNIAKEEEADVSYAISDEARNQSTARPDTESADLSKEENEGISFMEGELLRRAALASSSDACIAIISQACGEPGRLLTANECSQLIRAALAENNADLAFSILSAMRSSQIQRRVEAGSTDDLMLGGWRWPQPDVSTYVTLIRGLAATLRVTDAIRAVGDVKRRGIPAGDEVPFGKVVKCPTCDTALAVVQPHHGAQLVPCSKCRYQYELMSGDVVSCESEAISMNISALERGLRVLQMKKQPLPAAVHSFVVRSPDGLARTHRFATSSADVPAQGGERITVASAAPVNSARGIGPFKVNARTPGWRPSEPMSITNHVTGNVSPLLRAPPKSGSGAALDTSVVFPAAFLLASSDAATALIDPTLPRTIAISVAVAAVLGTAANTWILPQINQLPERTAEAIALRQELLAQYELLQSRLQSLTQEAAAEVRMLARMCQLQNKMEAIREPAYSARMERVRRVCEGLDEQLAARLELIDSYSKVASMIEIEVEIDADVLAAEAGGTVATISEQIERLNEVENLQKQWRMQAEANDELERLLQSSPLLSESG